MRKDLARAVDHKTPLPRTLAMVAQLHRVFHALVVNAGDGLDFHGHGPPV